MKRTVITCDKCGTDFEHSKVTFTIPQSQQAGLQARLGRSEPVTALDFCGACGPELLRLIAERDLTLLGLEIARDEAQAAGARCVARVRELEGKLLELDPEHPPTEPPEGMPDPLLGTFGAEWAERPETLPSSALFEGETPYAEFAQAPPLPEGFTLPGAPFAFSTEAPPVRVDEPAASSPLAFAHGGTP